MQGCLILIVGREGVMVRILMLVVDLINVISELTAGRSSLLIIRQASLQDVVWFSKEIEG